MTSSRVFLGLGSNTGDSLGILHAALNELCGALGAFDSSSLYTSAPLYVTDQPAFFNMACAGDWGDSPEALLSLCNGLEARFGRDRMRERRRGERTIDIDILLFGDSIVKTDQLTIPHECLAERKFALIPLLEIDPFARDPRSGKFWAHIQEKLPLQGIYYAKTFPYNATA